MPSTAQKGTTLRACRLGDWPGPPIVSKEHEAPIQASGVSMPSTAQKVPSVPGFRAAPGGMASPWWRWRVSGWVDGEGGR